MAYITLDSRKLEKNYKFLDRLFKDKHIEWSVVTKMLCGNKIFLKELLKHDIEQICDSRLSNIKAIKAIKPNIEAIYIKPPAKWSIPGIVKYADISMNTEISTIKLLAKEAAKQGKVHKIIIMIEMGELREGVIHENVISFYQKVFSLPNIKVVGIGTNLNCMYGVLPSKEKLEELNEDKMRLERRFNKKIKYLSGGSSVTIPLIFQNILPSEVNHFRVGETLYLGTDVYNDSLIDGMESDLFQFFAQIVELKRKPGLPDGEMGTNLEGESFEPEPEMSEEKSNRAIIDVGLLDVDKNHLIPVDQSIKVVGISSDVAVVDLGENRDRYKTGDFIEFKVNYTSLLKLLNSRYIDKIVN